jgi:ATP-dependent Lhr-like helicase
VDTTRIRRSQHTSFFPFAGRLVHEGLAALVAFRLTRRVSLSVRVTPNDYGFSLLSTEPFPVDERLVEELFSETNLLEDLLDCLNSTELARRQFREIARVAGLVQQGFPGDRKTNRQVQVSSGLLFDVFQRYDPDNLLIGQAKREVMEKQLEFRRLQSVIQKLQDRQLCMCETERLTPLAFPLWADQIGESLSSESRMDRIEKMLARLEKAADS